MGLPIHLGQLGLQLEMTDAIDAVVAGALTFAPLANFTFPVDSERLRSSMLAADKLGRRISDEVGNAAYERLHL